MVKLDINEVQEMLNAGKHLESNNASLNITLSTLRNFADESQLKGQTWNSAKTASTDAYVPLVQGQIAYNEAVIAGNKKVQSAVNSFPYPTPLDESLLTTTMDGYTQARNNYVEMVRELTYEMRANPTVVPVYQQLEREYQNEIESLGSAISELSKQVEALHEFASAVSGAYDEANSIKGNLEKGFSALGKGGSNAYHNGHFTITAMSAWAKDLTRDYTEETFGSSNHNFIDKAGKESPAFKNAMLESIEALEAAGWSTAGINDYIRYIETLVNNSHAPGDNFSYDNYVSLAYNTELLLLNANQLELSKKGQQYWLNGQPSYLFTLLAPYIPNLKHARAATPDEIMAITPPKRDGLDEVEEIPKGIEELEKVLGIEDVEANGVKDIVVDGTVADFATAAGVTADMDQINAVTTDNSVSRMLGSTTLTKQTNKVSNFVSNTKGDVALQNDFNSLNFTETRVAADGTTMIGKLKDGTTVDMHMSTSTQRPTMGIFNKSTGTWIKIRY
ncbi:T7SS effector LXG polymorphic toxin [Lactococcus nasutitermitis]|uniref:T7SS effector LXG polymorphic toxin n=1 Tax=Lactococcus nasutitermitis TaxID=1652957 RepID=A0ABV9JD67_9LACT|nr:T7SS effector LXG polymorphic toxin [Lactococcus nasutitermitis]